jgi:hypothetical protein
MRDRTKASTRARSSPVSGSVGSTPVKARGRTAVAMNVAWNVPRASACIRM